jgi:hypothetical protein
MNQQEIAEETEMTKADLNRWLKNAKHEPLRSSVVPWVTAESAHGWELAQEWIEAKDEEVAAAGWAKHWQKARVGEVLRWSRLRVE